MPAYHFRIAFSSRPNSTDQFPTFIPTSLWQSLPAHSAKSTARRNAIFNSNNKDYRLGPIRVDWMDLDASAARANESGVTGKTGGGKDRVAQGGMSPHWTALLTVMFNRNS